MQEHNESKRSRGPDKPAFGENDMMGTGDQAAGQDQMDDTEDGDETGYCYDGSIVPDTESTPCSSCSSGS